MESALVPASPQNDRVSRASAKRVRVIPVLLIDGRARLVKTVKFNQRTYIGDPINAVKIFNDKEFDEVLVLDIDATREGRGPNFALIEDAASEAFMPVGYGGGIRTLDQVARLFQCGIEKVVISAALEDNKLIEAVALRYGAQAVSVCMPVKRRLLGGYSVLAGGRRLPSPPQQWAQQVASAGAGEVIVYSVDRDGTYEGFDLDLIQSVATAVHVPVVACGGARNLEDFRAAVDAGSSAVAAGSMFVYQSKTRGVLISYPSQVDLRTKVYGDSNRGSA